MEKNLTQGSVMRGIITFSLPYLLAYFLQTLYGLADLFIIGQFCGVESTTAVSIGSQVMHMLTVMIVGLAMGSTVLIGRGVGAQNRDKINETIGNTITLFIVVALILTGVLVMSIDGIVSLMSTPTEAVAGAKDYLLICFIGIPFIIAYNVISSVFRGMGDSTSPMIFIGIACICNIALDYYFIGFCQMGPAGAALGTTIAQTISVIIAIVAIFWKKLIKGFVLSHMKPKKRVIFGILSIGGPVSLQDGFIQISFMVITILANQRGLTDAAAVGVVEKLISILFLVPSTMSSTVSALSSQNAGAGKHDRSKQTLKYAILINLIYGVVVAIALQFLAGFAVGLFTSDVDVIVSGSGYLRSYVIDAAIAGTHFCFSGLFCAYGYSGIVFFHNMVSAFCVRIPIAWYAATTYLDSLFPMGCAAPCGSVFSIVVCVICFVWMQKNPDRVEKKLAKV